MKTRSLAIFFASVLGLLLAPFVPLAVPPAEADETVYSFILSNEAPGRLVDRLIAQGHGDDTLLEVLGYLKVRSGGIISDEFYNQVAASPPGSEVFTATLQNYAGLIGGIEIAADGTISIPSVRGTDYDGAPGYGTAPSLDGQFTFTYAQDVAHYIYTHTNEYGGGITRDYYAFAIAWAEAPEAQAPAMTGGGLAVLGAVLLLAGMATLRCARARPAA